MLEVQISISQFQIVILFFSVSHCFKTTKLQLKSQKNHKNWKYHILKSNETFPMFLTVFFVNVPSHSYRGHS